MKKLSVLLLLVAACDSNVPDITYDEPVAGRAHVEKLVPACRWPMKTVVIDFEVHNQAVSCFPLTREPAAWYNNRWKCLGDGFYHMVYETDFGSQNDAYAQVRAYTLGGTQTAVWQYTCHCEGSSNSCTVQ